MTRQRFLEAYRAELVKLYDWANDKSKLDRFMSVVEETLKGGLVGWSYDGVAVRVAWGKIGGTGKPTLKALRALP